jgi:uroporphyrinogen III methyltransferase/synthase
VVVTRSRAQASGLADRLTALGATVVELPVIAIEDPADGGSALTEAADRLVAGGYCWVACTSSNAVIRLFAAVGNRRVPPSVRWAAVGAGTARRLGEGGVIPDLMPEVSLSDALADAFPEAGSSGPGTFSGPEGQVTVLFPRAETVRGALASGLRAKGWTVDEVAAYRTLAGAPDPEAIAAAGQADAIAFTSSSTVERTIDLLGADAVPPVVVSIGPITSATAREAGLAVTVEAAAHTIDGLVESLVAVVGQGESRPGGRGPGAWHQQQQQQSQQQ